MTTDDARPALALRLVSTAEQATERATILSDSGDLRAAVDAGRQTVHAYGVALDVLGRWLRSLPVVLTDDGLEVLSAGLADVRAAERRLDALGLKLDAMVDAMPDVMLAAGLAA